MSTTLKRIWALAMGAVIILLIFHVGDVRRTSVAGAAGKGPLSEPMLDLVWQRKSPVPASIISSLDGRFLAELLRDGKITCYSPKGGVLWQKQLEGVDAVSVAPDGSAIAASLLSPSQSTVYFISPKGEVLWRHDVRAAVWSIDASSVPGHYVAGVGERYCYVYTVTDRRHRYKRWRLPGAPVSAQFARDGGSILVGTWQDSGVGVFNLDGKRLAWWSGRDDRLYWAEFTRESRRIMAVAKPNPNQPQTTVLVKNQDLSDIWSQDFAYAGLASDVSADASVLAVGFRHVIEHNRDEISEKRIALFDAGGLKRWEKGGMFGQWNLLQVCTSGRLLLYDDSPSLCLVSEDGQIQLRAKLPGQVKLFARTPGRDWIALYLSDGEIVVYSVR